MLLVFYAIFHYFYFRQFLLRKPYTSTMLLVFYAIFHYKGKKNFSLLKKIFLSRAPLILTVLLSLTPLIQSRAPT